MSNHLQQIISIPSIDAARVRPPAMGGSRASQRCVEAIVAATTADIYLPRVNRMVNHGLSFLVV